MPTSSGSLINNIAETIIADRC